MKISFVMQSYLGDYPGSRENADKKFERAVGSLLNQTNPNWELVIIADGCSVTKRKVLLKKEFKDPRIVFKYIDRPSDRLMYTNGITRGEPRQVGRELATGDWIGYIDSDDFLAPNAVEELVKAFQKVEETSATRPPEKEIKAIWNRCIIENVGYHYIIKAFQDSGQKNIPQYVTNLLEFEGLPSQWIGVQGYMMATVTIFHRKDFPNHKWVDGTIPGVSEDMLFIDKMVKESPDNMGVINVPCYVRCHYKNFWDF